MGCATDGKRLRQTSANMLAVRHLRAGGFSTKYCTPDVHVGAFALPGFIADVSAKATRRSFRFVRSTFAWRTRLLPITRTFLGGQNCAFHLSRRCSISLAD
jgi:hypothetical protein